MKNFELALKTLFYVFIITCICNTITSTALGFQMCFYFCVIATVMYELLKSERV